MLVPTRLTAPPVQAGRAGSGRLTLHICRASPHPDPPLLHAGEGKCVGLLPLCNRGRLGGGGSFLYVCRTSPRPDPPLLHAGEGEVRGVHAQGGEAAVSSGAFQKPLGFFAQKKLEITTKRWLALLKYSFATPKKFVRRMAQQSQVPAGMSTTYRF